MEITYRKRGSTNWRLALIALLVVMHMTTVAAAQDASGIGDALLALREAVEPALNRLTISALAVAEDSSKTLCSVCVRAFT